MKVKINRYPNIKIAVLGEGTIDKFIEVELSNKPNKPKVKPSTPKPHKPNQDNEQTKTPTIEPTGIFNWTSTNW